MSRIAIIFLLTTAGSFAENSNEEIITQRRLDAVGQKLPDFRTDDGRTLANAVIRKVTDAGISIRYDSGTTRLRFSDLDIAQRKFFGLKENAALRTYQREEKQKETYENFVDEKVAAANARHVKFAEQQRIADEKARERLDALYTKQLAGSIPEQSSLSRVISTPAFSSRRSFFSRNRFSRFNSFGFRRSGFGFGNGFHSGFRSGTVLRSGFGSRNPIRSGSGFRSRSFRQPTRGIRSGGFIRK